MAQAHEKKFLHSLLLSGAEYDTIQKIRTAFASYRMAWQSSAPALGSAGLNEERITAIAGSRERMNPDEEMRKLVHQKIAFLTLDDADYPAPLRNIGVRIEDDVVITAAGCEVLTAETPKRAQDIEALMRDGRSAD